MPQPIRTIAMTRRNGAYAAHTSRARWPLASAIAGTAIASSVASTISATMTMRPNVAPVVSNGEPSSHSQPAVAATNTVMTSFAVLNTMRPAGNRATLLPITVATAIVRISHGPGSSVSPKMMVKSVSD